ncbi:beta-defensin 15 [Talpa occidentalis]|uniref:beta-defensin 15 n=1 Tax=Talpa occidentalis TaxID=50954 RepID=UPI00188EFDF3|nr:beta-defensin 15 [Talpa occidentalis]
MRTCLVLCALLAVLAPARAAFLDEKCLRYRGRCVSSCLKSEELVALCHRALKCCVHVEQCQNALIPPLPT